MKFQVEAISDERFLFVDVISEGHRCEVKIIPDAELGQTLRKIATGTPPISKRAYPKGTRKRRKTPMAASGTVTYSPDTQSTPTKEV